MWIQRGLNSNFSDFDSKLLYVLRHTVGPVPKALRQYYFQMWLTKTTHCNPSSLWTAFPAGEKALCGGFRKGKDELSQLQ